MHIYLLSPSFLTVTWSQWFRSSAHYFLFCGLVYSLLASGLVSLDVMEPFVPLDSELENIVCNEQSNNYIHWS